MGSQVATVRVYLLPDDTHRRMVDRSDPKLWKARRALLRHLDYSKGAWRGESSPSLTGYAALFYLDQNERQDVSLLEVFNKTPSPNPDPSLVSESHLRDAMYDLLQGDVSGLTTELHPTRSGRQP